MTTKAHIQQCLDNLYLVQLPVPLDGFKGFIGAWVYSGDPVTVVDVGPAVSSPHLLSALSELGVRRPDLILLTHIHIDHAGGIGEVSAAFPATPVVCHPDAMAHLVDPMRLWQGSLKTLGRIARAYGPIAPVAPKRVLAADCLGVEQITAVATPGHAAHHTSYLLEDLLFAGEAGGVCLPMDDDAIYLRPATPPRFFLETSLASIQSLLALNSQHICYGHIGRRSDAVTLLAAHHDQLLRWKEMIDPFFRSVGTDQSAAIHACCDHLLAADPLLAGFSSLPAEVRQRERDFLTNSLKGYWGYLSSKR